MVGDRRSGYQRSADPVDHVDQRQCVGDVAQEGRNVVDVKKDAGNEDHRQEDEVGVGRGRLKVRNYVREGDAHRGKAGDAEHGEDGQLSPIFRPAEAEEELAGDDDDQDLNHGVGRRAADDSGKVGGARQRRAAHALEHTLLAQEGHLSCERVEGCCHHAEPGDPRHQNVEVCLVAAEDGAEEEEEDQRQYEAEECGRRVAPEHLALKAVLAPGECCVAHCCASLVSSAVSSR